MAKYYVHVFLVFWFCFIQSFLYPPSLEKQHTTVTMQNLFQSQNAPFHCAPGARNRASIFKQHWFYWHTPSRLNNTNKFTNSFSLLTTHTSKCKAAGSIRHGRGRQPSSPSEWVERCRAVYVAFITSLRICFIRRSKPRLTAHSSSAHLTRTLPVISSQWHLTCTSFKYSP